MLLAKKTIDTELSPEKLKYLRTSDPSYSHLDWDNGAKWLSIFNNEIGTNSFSFLQNACEVFMNENFVLTELAKNGRESVVANLSSDEVQVFRNAGLLDKIPTNECVLWWDKLKLKSLNDLNKILMQQGRDAESWTFYQELEKVRLKNSELFPQWVSLEGDHYGYDIGSYTFSDEGNAIPIQIEVKSYSKASSPHFFLSDNQWDTAKEAYPNYFFYVWCVETKECKVFSVDDIAVHIPTDKGQGHWRSVSIKI